jgi:hypothetical protein
LNGALLCGWFLGVHTKTTPSIDVESVSRFTPLDHYASQVYHKNHQRLLSWEVSVMQQRLIFEELQAAGPEHEKTAWAEAPQAVCAEAGRA